MFICHRNSGQSHGESLASGLQSGSSTSNFAKPLGKGQLLGCHEACRFRANGQSSECPWQPEKGLPTTVSSNVVGKSLNEMEVYSWEDHL
jgi:hypothetical protein